MRLTLALSTALAAMSLPAMAQDCTTRIGVVMELTRPAGAYGQAGA